MCVTVYMFIFTASSIAKRLVKSLIPSGAVPVDAIISALSAICANRPPLDVQVCAGPLSTDQSNDFDSLYF